MDIKIGIEDIRDKLVCLEKLVNSDAPYDETMEVMTDISSLIYNMRLSNTLHFYAARIRFRNNAHGTQIHHLLLGYVSIETANKMVEKFINVDSRFILIDLVTFSQAQWRVLVRLWGLYRLRDMAAVLGVLDTHGIDTLIRSARTSLQFNAHVDRPCTLEDLRDDDQSPYGIGTQFTNVYHRIYGTEQ